MNNSQIKYPYIGQLKTTNTEINLLYYKPDYCIRMDDKRQKTTNNYNENAFKNITHEYLANTCGEVVSPEHAKFIIYFAGMHGIANEDLWYEGSFFCFIEDVKGDLVLSFYEEDVASSNNYKKITIPLPPKEGVIEWKDGAVCFANKLQHFALADFDTVKKFAHTYDDFQLNTIKQGDYIPKSELDTEDKYNRAVEVFGLFGFARKISFEETRARKIRDCLTPDKGIVCDGISVKESRKITFNQLMAIGELKRLEIERNNTVLSSDEETELKSRAMASELNSQSNDDEWPKVGDDVCYKNGNNKGVVLAVDGSVAWVKSECGSYTMPNIKKLVKPKTPEDLLIEELQTKLVKNNAVDNWMLAANIISGDIEGLTYTSKDGK